MATTSSAARLSRTLRVLGVADIASGIVAVAAGGWLAQEVGVSAWSVRAAGALLIVLGIATLASTDRSSMAPITIVVEAACAVLTIGLVLFAGATAIGIAVLIGCALWCTAAAIETAVLRGSAMAAVSVR
jgi:hypothetical protein